MIALPNNVTNLSRALYLLQHEGLITLKAGHEDPARDLATVHDIATAPQAVGEFGGSIVTPPMQFFQRMGASPVIAARVAGLQALPTVVEGTDLVALVPRMLAARAARSQRIAVVEVPEELEVPRVEAMYWHPLHTSDPANLWLRSLVRRAAQELEPGAFTAHPVPVTAS